MTHHRHYDQVKDICECLWGSRERQQQQRWLLSVQILSSLSSLQAVVRWSSLLHRKLQQLTTANC